MHLPVADWALIAGPTAENNQYDVAFGGELTQARRLVVECLQSKVACLVRYGGRLSGLKNIRKCPNQRGQGSGLHSHDQECSAGSEVLYENCFHATTFLEGYKRTPPTSESSRSNSHPSQFRRARLSPNPSSAGP